MIRLIFYFLIVLTTSYSECSAQNLAWIKSIGGSDYNDKGTTVVADNNGTIYLGGHFKNVTAFGDGSVITSYGGTDIFISKYSSDGTCSWTRQIGGTSEGAGGETDILHDMAVDADGNILVVGRFMDNCEFGDTSFVMSGMLWNGFIAKYDPSGTLLWAQKFGSTALIIKAIAVDPVSNGFYITGDLNSDASFGTVDLLLTDSGDAFIVKFNEQGQALWGTTGVGEQAFGNEITCDQYGSVYVIGDAYGTSIDFDGTVVPTNSGSNDIFIVKYNSVGTLQWLKTFGGVNEFDFGLGLFCDLDNKIYATGKIQGIGQFDSFSFDAVNQGSFLLQADYNGNVIWLTGGETGTWGLSIGMDSANNVYWYGTVGGSTTISNQPVNGNGGDIFIATFSETGDFINILTEGGANQQGSNSGRNISMSVNQNGAAYITGQYYLTADFSDSLLNSNGTFDIYFAKYEMNGSAFLNKIMNLSEIVISPNPAFDYFFITAKNEQINEVIIRDIYGKEVMSFYNLMVESAIPIYTLSQDIYFVEIISEQGIATRKLVKQ